MVKETLLLSCSASLKCRLLSGHRLGVLEVPTAVPQRTASSALHACLGLLLTPQMKLNSMFSECVGYYASFDNKCKGR